MGSNSNPNSSSFNFGADKIYMGQTTANSSGTGFNEGHLAGSRGSASSSSSSSSRRGSNQGGQQQQQPMGRCQVVGCGVDLSGAKPYYCKHRVCGPHSKSPRVIVGGIEQRFCQQCSRFHLLSEFDQGKRSCRRRLAGHNERRRRPPPGPLLTHTRHFSPFYHEDGSRSRGFIMDFTRPRATIEFGSNESSHHNPTLVQTNTPQFSQTRSASSLQFSSNANEALAGVPSSSRALSLLSSPVQWIGPAETDSFQNSLGFRGYLEGNMSSSSVQVHQNIGLEITDRSEPSRFSGELESALHGSRQRVDDNRRVFGHGDPDAGHDVIHWSL
ncbi:hypothetical protein LUZ60_008645 [Juncus effusus]|nr:hypothetical protein LUZ60_008645 [Juncus effusus]